MEYGGDRICLGRSLLHPSYASTSKPNEPDRGCVDTPKGEARQAKRARWKNRANLWGEPMQPINFQKSATRTEPKRTASTIRNRRSAVHSESTFGATGIPGPERLARAMRIADSAASPMRDHSAEHQLSIAILEMSLREYEQQPRSRRVVRSWIEEQNGPPPFSFDSVCDYLSLDADYVRDGLIQWMNDIDRGVRALGPLGGGMRVRNRAKTITLERKRHRKY
jgi:hypothetical protein